MENVKLGVLCVGALYLLSAALIVVMALVSLLRALRKADGPADRERMKYLREMLVLATSGLIQDTVLVLVALPLVAWFVLFP